MNKKLIKRVAVASLAAIITIPCLTANSLIKTSYAMTVQEIEASGMTIEEAIKKDLVDDYASSIDDYVKVMSARIKIAKEEGKTQYAEKLEKNMNATLERHKQSKEKESQKAAERKAAEAQKQAAKELNKVSDDEETNQQVKGSYANDIERVKLRINKLKEEIEDAKINNPSMVDFLEKELHRENEDIEYYTLLEQYIINEDPNTDPELIKKWNINKLTGIERYIWYGRSEPLRITDDFIVYEDKTEFSFYNDTYDSSGGKTRAFTKIYNDNNVKTNLDPNRYTVKSLSLPGEYHYIIVDNMPNYQITYKRDDMNIRINRALTIGNIVECDYQIFDFTLECPISAPINGDRKYSKLVFNPYDINLYRIKRSELTKKEEYIVTLGVQIKENEELSMGINNYEIARILRQTEVYPPTNNLMVSHERISAENINIKTLEFRVEYSNKQLSLGLAPEW